MYQARRKFTCSDNKMKVLTLTARLCVSENGWTDGELALKWMIKDFNPQTKEKAGNETRVLLMDGHNSHYSADLLEYCVANNIEVLGYPPHCTHALQGLDVVCFAKMKSVWKEEINIFETVHRRGVDKDDFCSIFGRAFLRAFTTENVEAAFQATGIYPYNPDVIRPEQMKPAETTSIRSSFPLLQPSPVRAVISACQNHQFTRQECYPNSPPLAGSSSFPGSSSKPTTPTGSPQVQSQKRHLDPAADPDHATPSKRMRFLAEGLSRTSGSILITKARTTHLEMAKFVKPPVCESIPPEIKSPNWSLLQCRRPLNLLTRNELEDRVLALTESLERSQQLIAAQQVIIEGANAQMVVQNLAMEKASLSLHEKEKKKKSDRTILFPGGKGRHLTDPEVIRKKQELEEERAQEEAEKERRKLAKDNRKVEKEQLEAQWRSMLDEYECSVGDWEKVCQLLRSQGVLVKNLPKKPKRPQKPKLKEIEEETAGDGPDDEEEGLDDAS